MKVRRSCRNYVLSLSLLDINYPGYDHVKAGVLRIPKMWYFLRFGGFKPELSAVKVKSNFTTKKKQKMDVKRK